MKKAVLISTILSFLIAIAIPFPASAASSASLSGPEAIRAGETVTLTFSLNGNGILGVSGMLSYDAGQVTLSETKQLIGSPWTVEFNGNNFVAYDNDLANPIHGSKALFSVTFKVKSVAPGTSVKISCTGVKASDGNADSNVGTVTYSKTVSAPLATNNNLASLTVGNATLSPAFSAETTAYTASVPFEVSKLTISAAAADGKAKVSVNSPTLTPNETTNVTVTVTAENGAKKTYTVAVTRGQDPNYVASNNNNLSGITVEGFLLSPAFTPENTRYAVWLPYETESIKIVGSAADSKASVTVEGGETLSAGQDNTVKVICTAESGEQKEYTVTVKRAAAHDGSVEELPQDTSSDTQPPATDLATDTDINPQTPAPAGLTWWWLVSVGITCFALGYAVAYLLLKTSQKNSAK